MQDSFAELLNLLLEIIVDYIEFTSYKNGKILHPYLKRLNSIPKEYRQNKLAQFFDEITVQDFPIRGHQVYLHHAQEMA
jgi:hypothetical protein